MLLRIGTKRESSGFSCPNTIAIRQSTCLPGGATKPQILRKRPDRNPHLARLVDQVGIDAIAGAGDHGLGQRFEHLVVAAEGCRLLEPFPVGPERDVDDLAIPCPERRDMFAASRVAAVEQDHVGVFGEDLVERGPDAVVILVGGTRGECDPGARREQRFCFGATLGSEEVAAVNHGGGQGVVIDE